MISYHCPSANCTAMSRNWRLRRLSCFNGLFYCFQPGVKSRFPLFFNASQSNRHHSRGLPAAKLYPGATHQRSRSAAIADLPDVDQRVDRLSAAVVEDMQLGVHAAFWTACEATAYAPFLDAQTGRVSMSLNIHRSCRPAGNCVCDVPSGIIADFSSSCSTTSTAAILTKILYSTH